jgi:hypothetical protein
MSQAAVDSTNTQTASEEAVAPAFESIPENQTNTPVEVIDQGGSGEVNSSNGATQSLEEALASVKSPDEYEAMMAKIQQNPQAFAKPTEQKAQSNVATEQAPAASETNTAPAENAGGQTQTQTSDDDFDDDGKKYPQFRLRPTDDVDAEAMRIKKAADLAGSPISLVDAVDIAKRKLGIASEQPAGRTDATSTTTATQEAADDDKTDFAEGLTVADVKQELKDLRKQHSQALRNGDLDEAADVMDKITETEDLLEVVEQKESFRTQNQREQHDRTFETSAAKATELFPDFNEPESEFFQRCKEIDEALRDTEDPRYYDAEKPLLIARMAARELNIAPGKRASAVTPAPAVATATKPAPPQQQQTISPQPPRTEKPGQLPAASGASRTNGSPTGAAASLVDQVAKIKSVEEFERLARQVHAANR